LGFSASSKADLALALPFSAQSRSRDLRAATIASSDMANSPLAIIKKIITMDSNAMVVIYFDPGLVWKQVSLEFGLAYSRKRGAGWRLESDHCGVA
jgi:hypothetical protein